MNPRRLLKRWVYGSCPGLAGAFRYYGTQVFFPKGSQIFARACADDIYEKETLRLLAALVRRESVYFDIGANIGLLSIPLLRQFPACRVVSFEPSPNTLSFLQRTHHESGFAERWRIVGKAVGRKTGELELFAHAPALGAFDSFRDTQRAGRAEKTMVPVTTVDTEWEALGRPEVSMIKIDVEGAEMEVLEGATACLAAHRPTILLEWNAHNLAPFDCPPDALLSFAERHGYAIFGVPLMVPVPNAAALKLQMLGTENFLLVPDPAPASWDVQFEGFCGLHD